MPGKPKPVRELARARAGNIHKMPIRLAEQQFQRFTRRQATPQGYQDALHHVSERLKELHAAEQAKAAAKGLPFKIYDAYEFAAAFERFGHGSRVFTAAKGPQPEFVKHTRNELTYFRDALPPRQTRVLEYQVSPMGDYLRRTYVHWTPEGEIEKVTEEETHLTVRLKTTYRCRLGKDNELYLTKE